MLHHHLKLPAGGAAVLLAFLLVHACAVQAASLPRYHRLRGGESEAPLAAYPSNSDMQKALEYIENLKQGTGAREMRPVDVDKMERSRVQVELASRLQEATGDRQPPVSGQRQAVSAEQLLEALVKYIQDLVGREAKTAAAVPRSDRRAYRHRPKESGSRTNAPPDYDNFPRPHKKYPLMFEDEENRDAYKRATEDLDEQYTPQSLANLRSIFEELGRMPTTAVTNNGQKRGEDEADADTEDEEMLNLRNVAYEDVTGGEDWVPVEEKEEAEEMVNGSHEEVDRGLDDFSEQQEAENEEIQRRASPDQEDTDDDTKLVDYYLLKVLEMSDQTQKRDQTGEQTKRLIRPSIVDPRTVKELLELSLKLHVPPQDLINTLITEEFRKLRRRPPVSAHYQAGQAPKIRYYSRRLPLKAKSVPEDMDREDFLDIIGVETISNEYPVMQRPAKPASNPDRAPAPPIPAAHAAPAAPVKVPPPAGRRENLFLSELNKMPLRRQAGTGGDEGGDEDDVEDEVTTYLAAKILTEYPNGISKRDTLAQQKGQFPYELYEQAVKDYLHGQVDTDTGAGAKRETESATEPADTQEKDGAAAKTSAHPQTVAKDDLEDDDEVEKEEEEQRRHGNPM